MSEKRVYIAHTGGTIGMRRSARGWKPEPGALAELMSSIPELRSPEMPRYELHEYDPLLDSANMSPSDWIRIAEDIARHHDEFDGFVVLHGTDTMAWTASALPFLLEGLRKPVILTGSQIPLCEIRSDARANLITSMMIAAEHPIPEVCLFFGSHLLRGCRSVKVSAVGFDAFASPNYPPLGEAGIDVLIDRARVREAPPADSPLIVHPVRDPVVAAIRLFPGMSAQLMRNITQPPLVGLVIEAYGVGNGPDRDPDLIGVLEEAVSRGVVIVDATQCLEGRVDLTGYATGKVLAKAGLISAADMTTEAALAKLYCLASRGLDSETIKRLMQEDLAGELTER